MVAGLEDAGALAGDAHAESTPPATESTPPARKDIAMDADLVRSLRSWRVLRKTPSTDLTTCSLCLRVRRGSEWLEAEQFIRETRSYELDAPPRLHSGVCDLCAESIFSRRAQVDEPIAA
jgi:hypothetical protein